MKKIFFFSLILFISCESNSKKEEAWPVDFDHLVDLHCQSIHLKNERFLLADSIRYTEDSIMRKEARNEDVEYYTQLLSDLKLRKESLTEESYTLSDTIENIMKRVIRELDQAEKRVFNDSLQKMTKERDCR